MTRQDAERELIEIGAKVEKKEDRHGQTKSGWWLDDVWLAPVNQPKLAIEAIK